jgi:hypothetical protein
MTRERLLLCVYCSHQSRFDKLSGQNGKPISFPCVDSFTSFISIICKKINLLISHLDVFKCVSSKRANIHCPSVSSINIGFKLQQKPIPRSDTSKYPSIIALNKKNTNLQSKTKKNRSKFRTVFSFLHLQRSATFHLTPFFIIFDR